MLKVNRSFALLAVSLFSAAAFAQIDQYDSSAVRKVELPREMTYLTRQYVHSPMQIWDEKQNVQLPTSIRVDICQPGTYRSWQDLGNYPIPAGRYVNCSMLYFGRYDHIDTTVTFGHRIIGVIVTSDVPGEDRLLATDGAILPGVPPQEVPRGHFRGRGLEMPLRDQAFYKPNDDWIEVEDNAVTVHLTVGGECDQVRVFTDPTDGAQNFAPSAPSQPANPAYVAAAPGYVPIPAFIPTNTVAVPAPPPTWNFGLNGRVDALYQRGPILIYPNSIVGGVTWGGNVPVLDDGYRIGYVQADAGYSYSWDGYAYWPYTQVVFSPWYYYPALPPYINLSYAYTAPPVVYVNPVAYSYVVEGSGGSLTPLDEAINEIVDSFDGHEGDAIYQLLPGDGYVAIYLGGVYRYSIAEKSFEIMLRDLLKGVTTNGYRIASVDKYDGGSVLVVAAQDTVDPWGNKTTIYQEFRLIEEDGHWVIREFGTSNAPISTEVVALKHLDPLSPSVVLPVPLAPSSFNFGLRDRVYLSQPLQHGTILINAGSLVQGVTFASPVPLLESGFRIGYVQIDPLFKFGWDGYDYWPYDQVVFSPWYYYPSLPPYLKLGVAYADVAPGYEDPVAYDWISAANEGVKTPLDDAIKGIVSAYHSQTTGVLDELFPTDGYVGIYLNGTYRYSLDWSSFSSMMRDVTVNAHTSTFKVVSVHQYKGGSVLALAEHVIIDPWGRKVWVYQMYRLEEENGKWVIREFGTSNTPFSA